MIEKYDRVIIYQPPDDLRVLEMRLKEEIVWLNQKQIFRLFGIERSMIIKHISNIFKTRELWKDSVCANFALSSDYPTVAKDATIGQIHVVKLFDKNN
ncbi:MAG: hypothetical protein COT43_06670 [Candidatus Marinimicrobia bacterium CG08_land_8_20_14_0_20_45_22]|nr:MAG: hypothetical protein COT43_06670 [Candidatus Marinimicrobia bacterium CG08_land_8_20_14_0_20_45_22]